MVRLFMWIYLNVYVTYVLSRLDCKVYACLYLGCVYSMLCVGYDLLFACFAFECAQDIYVRIVVVAAGICMGFSV